MAALLALLRVSNEMGEVDALTGYGPSSRVLRAASTINYISMQDDTRPAATPAPCSTAHDHDGSSRVQQRNKSGSATRLTTTPSRATVALHDDQPRQHGDYIFIGNSAIDGQPDYYGGNYNN